MGTPASGSPASGPKVEQDLDFQRREWTFQRIGWAVMLAIVVAGLLGLFATGPLSRTTVTNDDRTLRVSFERFTRFGSPTQLVIDVPPGAIGGGEARIALSRDYLTAFQVQAVAPEAERVEAAGADLVYVFKVDQGSGLEATFNLQADERWRKSAVVRVPERPPVSFGQFVYP